MFTTIDKALMSFVLPAILPAIQNVIGSALGHVGITGNTPVDTAINMLLSGLLVFLIPNKSATK